MGDLPVAAHGVDDLRVARVAGQRVRTQLLIFRRGDLAAGAYSGRAQMLDESALVLIELGQSTAQLECGVGGNNQIKGRLGNPLLMYHARHPAKGWRPDR